MYQERSRGILRRSFDIITGRTSFTVDESERFLEFMDRSVKDAFVQDPALDPEAAKAFYSTVFKSATDLKTAAQNNQRIRRRTLLGGAGAIGILAASKFTYDRLFAPYADDRLERAMTNDEKIAFERKYSLTSSESIPSLNHWRISYDTKDPSQKWEEWRSFPGGKWIDNFSKGDGLSFSLVDSAASSTKMWFNEYETSYGTKLPVFEIETGYGADIKILGNESADPQADMTAIKFTHPKFNGVRYLAVRRLEVENKSYFEAKLMKKVPA